VSAIYLAANVMFAGRFVYERQLTAVSVVHDPGSARDRYETGNNVESERRTRARPAMPRGRSGRRWRGMAGQILKFAMEVGVSDEKEAVDGTFEDHAPFTWVVVLSAVTILSDLQ